MVEYDPKFIREHANKLYAQSKTIIPAYFFIGLLLGLLTFDAISNILTGWFDFLITALGVLIGAFMGLGAGINRSEEIKLRAQELLGQVEMVESCRR